MKALRPIVAVCSTLVLATTGHAATGEPFYGDPPDAHHPWAIHDQNRPQPKAVLAGTFSSQSEAGKPPSDAVVLFDGKDFSQWERDKKEGGPVEKWTIEGGSMVVMGGGGIRTKAKFGDCQLHVEWASPTEIKSEGQGRGNSGIFLMGICECQVLDSYKNETYADGGAGSYYGVNPPLVNPLNKSGDFQMVDIVFRRPVFKGDEVLDPGYMTVFINGVLVQDHTRLEGPTGHMARTNPKAPFPEVGPLSLQDHGNPVRFRNIWYRPLPPRAVEGGTDGPISAEATAAKRQEIAASIRADAATLQDAHNPLPELKRWMESLVYEKNEAVFAQVSAMAGLYVASVKKLTGDQLADKKEDVKRLRNEFRYMIKHKLFPGDFAPKAELDAIISAQGWEK